MVRCVSETPILGAFMTKEQIHIEIAKIIVSILGFGGAIFTLYLAYRQYQKSDSTLQLAYKQYQRSEEWKRGEFIAKEIREFEFNLVIKNALYMIDWGSKRINLFLKQNPDENDYVEITRKDQWRALLPDIIKGEFKSISNDSITQRFNKNGTRSDFTSVETKIRDTYDDLFVNLQRIFNFTEANLITPKEIEPYLKHWIVPIVKKRKYEYRDDAPWRYTLIAYINYYDYSKVILLFGKLGEDIRTDGTIFKDLEKKVKEENPELVKKIQFALNSKRLLE
jgi:hypothetical protein